MTIHPRLLAALISIAAALLWPAVTQAAITHRWNFNGNANDTVGSLNWTVNGGASFAGGAANFDGIDDFLQLNTTPLPTSGSTTVEVWGTYNPSTPLGSRIFDFSSSNGDLYFFLSPNAQNVATTAGNSVRNTTARWDDDFDIEFGPRGGGPSNTGNQVLLTLVYDSAAMPATGGPGEFRLYRDGLPIATVGTEGLNILGFSGVGTTTVNRLGHGISATTEANATPQNDNPPTFLNGSINEFRTWNNALTESQLFINAVAGPDQTTVTFADTTWNNAGTGDWNQSGNWSGGIAPTVAQRAVIGNGGTATVTGSSPQAGTISITNGALTISGSGALDSKFPIDLTTGATNTAAINVNSGGQLTISRISGDTGTGSKLLTINGGTILPGFSNSNIDANVPVAIGAQGATFSATAGRRLLVQGVVSGAGNIAINGAGKVAFAGGTASTYTGEVTVNNSTLDLTSGWQSFSLANRIVLNNSTIEAVPGGGGGEILRTPIHLPDGTSNTLIHRGIDNSAERLPFLLGDITGGGMLHYTTTRTVPIGFDFGGILATDPPGCVVGGVDPCTVTDETDNSGFTGKIVVDDVTGNAAGMIVAARIRSPGGDFPNAIFELNSAGSRLGKRGTDANQTIELGGISGVAGTFLTPTIAGIADAGAELTRNTTFMLGGASEDASFDGFIQDENNGAVLAQATVVKVGGNTQTIGGPSSYSGTTTVNGGTLLVNGTHSMSAVAGALPVGDYTVNAGGTLGGTGTIGSATDQVNVTVIGGALAPGAGPGTLAINGNYSQNSGSTLAIEIGGTPGSGLFDVLSISGSATLAGELEVSLVNSPTLNVGDMFTVLTASSVTGAGSLSLAGPAASSFELNTSGNSLVLEFIGGGTVSGDFDGDGDVDGRDFLRWQRGQSPNPLSSTDLQLWKDQYGTNGLAGLAAVPEPGSLWLVACGCLVGAARRKT
jgi:autotransporter-associated beta strand protein